VELGIIGLGRMGANIARRLMKAGHTCFVYDVRKDVVDMLAKEGAHGADSMDDLVKKMASPPALWLMLPAAIVDQTLDALVPKLPEGSIVIDGGNSHYQDDIRRAKTLHEKKLHYLDVGTSGGVWGLERGYCLMIGGDTDAVQKLDPLFAALAPGVAAAPRTLGRENTPLSTSERGYLHCGQSGAGHFVKMVHNGIEYGLMAAYAEGFNILRNAGFGKQTHHADAETAPVRNPEAYQFDFSISEVAEVWRRGAVIGSWLLDLAAIALHKQPQLDVFTGRVADSGEGRWTVAAAIDEGVPAPVLSAALYERFSSRGKNDFADRLLSAMRFEFGGHMEKQSRDM